MSAVVVLSPSRFSLNMICVTELLLRNDVQVKALVVRRLLNRRRFVSEFGRDGSRLVRKIWRKLVLRRRAYQGRDFQTIVDFMDEEGFLCRSAEDLRDKYGIAVHYCYDLNDANVVDTLRRARPNVVVFTGGGLIRRDVLEVAGDGILNCHMGVLPRYRGMDVVEWPIVEGRPEQVGMTVHFMDEGVDTGDILRVTKVDSRSSDTIGQLRDRFEPIMCRQLAQTCADYLSGRVRRTPQRPEDGRQYFIMHPRLREVAEAKLSGNSSVEKG